MIQRHASRAVGCSSSSKTSIIRRPAAPKRAPLPAPRASAAPSSSSSSPSTTTTTTTSSSPYGWRTDAEAQAQAAARRAADPRVREVPVAAIRRPLGRTRKNDQAKVEALVASIAESGLLEPIDVLEVDGVIYGFSGCHRFEAHQRMGRETILCRVRKATRDTLMMHLR